MVRDVFRQGSVLGFRECLAFVAAEGSSNSGAALHPCGAKMSFEFDASTHTYRKDGVILPNITLILDAYFSSHRARERDLLLGTRIHQACALIDQEDLDWETVDPEVYP